MLKSFALRTELKDRKAGGGQSRWQPPIDVLATKGRADSGDLELDLIELFTDVASLGRRPRRRRRAVRRRDAGHPARRARRDLRRLPRDQPAGRAADRRRRRAAAPARRAVGVEVLRRAALPLRRRRPPPPGDGRARLDRCPAASEDATYEPKALDELYRLTDGYPYFVQAYGKVTWDVAVESPITWADVMHAAPEAEAELAVGFFGARYDRATPAERDYMTAMADLGEGNDDLAVSTADVARLLGRKPQSLSPARDGLIKKGLVFSGERGTVAFTVPHFGKFLRSQR